MNRWTPNYAALWLLYCISLGACHPLEHNDQLPGYIEGDFTYIASPVAGRLTSLDVARGQQVLRGQQLFSLDPEPELSELHATEAQLKGETARLRDVERGQRSTIITGLRAQIQQVQSDLTLFAVRLERTKKLLAGGNIDKNQYDEAVANYQKNNALLTQRKAELEEALLGGRSDAIIAQQARVTEINAQITKAKWVVAQKTMRAPADALVYDTFYLQNEFTNANSPVVALLKASDISVIFFIPEPLISRIKLGDAIAINCDGCAQAYQGKISFISPKVEFTPPIIYSRASNYKYVFRVEASIDSSASLHPGQPVYINLHTSDRTS